MQDVDILIGERQHLGINMANDLTDFHLHFLTITTWLINKKQLSDLKQKRSYLHTFQPSLLSAIMGRLQTKFPAQHPNIPHAIKDVFDAANHMLQSMAVTQQFVAPTPSVPPITILQQPSVPVAVPPTLAPVVKTENLGVLFSEFMKTIIKAMNKNLRGPASNPQMASSSSQSTAQKLCIMCAGLHLIGQCRVVDEFITAGKCKRNHEGQVVLLSGSYVPQDILPEAILMDQINEYHRRFPNQLAAATLIHTIASVAANQNTIAPAQSTFRLSKEDHIATLEAELFNLRRGPPAPAGGVRTRNQRAREQEAKADEEIVTPGARQKPAEVSKPVAPIVPITAEPPVTITE